MLCGDSTPAGWIILKYQLAGRALLRITTNQRPADVEILIMFVYTFESQWSLDTRFVKKSGMLDIQQKFFVILCNLVSNCVSIILDHSSP